MNGTRSQTPIIDTTQQSKCLEINGFPVVVLRTSTVLCESCEQRPAVEQLDFHDTATALPFSLCQPCADDACALIEAFDGGFSLTALDSPYARLAPV